MRKFSITTDISAPAERVWQVMSDDGPMARMDAVGYERQAARRSDRSPWGAGR